MKLRKEKDVVIIELSPDDLTDAKELSNVMERLLLEDGERKIVADLTRVDAIYSLQIGSLVTMHVMCYENVAVMKLAGANEKVKNLLRMVGLETKMEMHHGPDVAAQSFGSTPKDSPRAAPQPRVRK